MTSLKSLTLSFDPGDPVVQTWTLVRPDYLPFLISGLYLFFVKILGPQLMKGRRPFDLRYCMIFYNYSLVVTYIACVSTLLYILATTNASSTFCRKAVVMQNHYSYLAISAAWVIYLLKYMEFADTIFFVLRKKYHQITNLHLIHHTIMPIAVWLALRTETTSFQLIPLLINSIVHIVMYTYYGLAASGPEMQKYLGWKKYLTRIQMTQFVLIIIILNTASFMGCTTSSRNLHLYFLLMIVFLVLFTNFYIKTYNSKQKQHKK